MKQNVVRDTRWERSCSVLQFEDCLFLGNNVISCEITWYKDIFRLQVLLWRSCLFKLADDIENLREKRETAFLPVQWYALVRSNIGLMCAIHCDHDMSWEKNLQVVWLVSRLINNNDYVKQDNRVINKNPPHKSYFNYRCEKLSRKKIVTVEPKTQAAFFLPSNHKRTGYQKTHIFA